jgi:transcriptional regulator with XRE-family HTH domain
VFSPGRLRAVRDLHRLTRAALADHAGLSAEQITGYETGTATPSAEAAAVLADALGVRPADLTGPAGADDSWEYWGVICAARPPMTEQQISMLATVLRRIDKHRTHRRNRPGE